MCVEKGHVCQGSRVKVGGHLVGAGSLSPWDKTRGSRHSECLYTLRHLQGPVMKFEVNELFMCAKWVLLSLDYDNSA